MSYTARLEYEQHEKNVKKRNRDRSLNLDEHGVGVSLSSDNDDDDNDEPLPQRRKTDGNIFDTRPPPPPAGNDDDEDDDDEEDEGDADDPDLAQLYFPGLPSNSKAVVDDGFCFGCATVTHKHKENDPMSMLIANVRHLMNTTYCKYKRSEFVETVYLYYKEHVLPHTVDKREWSRKCILAHVEKHDISMTVTMTDSVRRITECLDAFQENDVTDIAIRCPEKNIQIDVDHRKINSFLKLLTYRDRAVEKLHDQQREQQ